MIIHILGASGSGKTTLGNKLSKLKNTVIIDTDDIDDPNSMKLINNYDLDTKRDINKLNKKLSELNKTDLDRVIKKGKNKNIIFVGFPHRGMNSIFDIKDVGYQIKIEPYILFKQYSLRSLNTLHNNFNEIKKLLNSGLSEEKIHWIVSKKYGLRNGFGCADINVLKEELKRHKKKAKETGYKYKDTDEIYKDICSIFGT